MLALPTDQELSLKFSVSYRYIAMAVAHSLLAGLAADLGSSNKFLMHSSPQNWNVSMCFFIEFMPVINAQLFINTYYFSYKALVMAHTYIGKEHSFFVEYPIDNINFFIFPD